MELIFLSERKTISTKINGNRIIRGKTLDSERDGEAIPFHKISLFNQNTNEYVDFVFSNEKGEYAFSGIDEGPFFIVSHYIDDSKNGEMADNITPQRDPRYDQIID